MVNYCGLSVLGLSGMFAALLIPTAACGGEPGGTSDESSSTSAVETPPDSPDEEVPEESDNTPAAQTGEPLKEEPPPILEVRDEATNTALLQQLAANRAAANAPGAWFTRFKQAADAPPTLALVEVVSDDGPDPTKTGRLSTWKVHDVLAGAALPANIVLFQSSPGGELGECAMVAGSQGRVDAALVEPDGSYFRLLVDNDGKRAFLIRAGDTHYVWHGGPRIAATDLATEAGAW
jgi:hypothetical protein